MIEKNLPYLLLEKSKLKAADTAFRIKKLGIWHETSWESYYNQVEGSAFLLESTLSVSKGEKIAILSENNPDWLINQMAIQLLGGVSVGVYPESLPKQVAYYLNDCQARIVICEDQEQVDKVLEIEERLPYLKHIIYLNEKGMEHYNHSKLIHLNKLLKELAAEMDRHSNYYEEKVKEIKLSDVALVAYSAATTGDPRGVVLTHENIISAAENLLENDLVLAKDEYLSFLPLAWINEQVLVNVAPLLSYMIINFPEQSSTVLVNLREIGPHTLLAPPRVLQTLMSNFITRINYASPLKKRLYYFFKKYGDRQAASILGKQKISFFDKVMYHVGDFIIFSAIRDQYGLSRIKRVYIAGASLNREVMMFFHSIGVNLKQTYGGTELGGIAFVQEDANLKLGSSGQALPNTELKITDKEEVLIKNKSVFSHYLHEEDQKSVDNRDGWFYLGDLGYLDDENHLFILEREIDVIKINEAVIYPTQLESKLKMSPYIQEAIVLGEGYPFLTAIINIDEMSVSKWADEHGIGYNVYEDLALNDDIILLIKKEIQKLMASVSQAQKVKRFVVLHKLFNANDGELTRTLKLRRKYIKDSYGPVLDAMYKNLSTVTFTNKTYWKELEVTLSVVSLKEGETL